MDLALGLAFATLGLGLLVLHVLLLVHIAKTRKPTVLLAALLVPPVAPLSCLRGGATRLAGAWLLVLLGYALLLAVVTSVR